MKVSRRGNVYFVKRRVRHHTTANRDRVLRLLWRVRRLWLSGRTVEAADREYRKLKREADWFHKC